MSHKRRMKHLPSLITAAIGLALSIAGLIFRDHKYTAIALLVCAVLFWLVALRIAFIESIPRPRIRLDGIGPHGRYTASGLLVRNDGDPAYNVSVPAKIKAGSNEIVFTDPVITELTQQDGIRCFEITVLQSHGGQTTLNSVRQQLILAGHSSFKTHFQYADGSRPKLRRYTVHLRIFATTHGWSVAFDGEKPNYLLLWLPWIGRETVQ